MVKRHLRRYETGVFVFGLEFIESLHFCTTSRCLRVTLNLRYFDRYSEFILIVLIFIFCARLGLNRDILFGVVFRKGDGLLLLIVAYDSHSVARLCRTAKLW